MDLIALERGKGQAQSNAKKEEKDRHDPVAIQRATVPIAPMNHPENCDYQAFANQMF